MADEGCEIVAGSHALDTGMSDLMMAEEDMQLRGSEAACSPELPGLSSVLTPPLTLDGNESGNDLDDEPEPLKEDKSCNEPEASEQGLKNATSDDDNDTGLSEEVASEELAAGKKKAADAREEIRYRDIYIPAAPPRDEKEKEPLPRLIITHIDNENFKSYAGKQILGPFHKCFNAIIGPNGSGKSNVIDSMLFVFGYRASKIRSKKLSVLIHTSDNAGAMESCTVAVHFAKISEVPEKSENSEKSEKKSCKSEIVADSKFTIARTAFRDNSSYYTINGRREQFKTVAALLRANGIDLDHNRFLILQGEVEQIAMMKSKGDADNETGMLEFIEDIVGTTVYREPLDKLNGIVNEFTEERLEKINRLKIVEKEKEALEKPVSEAKLYLEAENDITMKKNNLLQRNIMDDEKDLKKHKDEKKNLQDELNVKTKALKEIDDKETELKKQIADLEKEYNNVNAYYEKQKESFNSVNARDVGVQAETVQLSKNRKKMKDQLSDEKKKLNDLESVPEKNEKEIQEINTLEEKLKGEKVTAEKECDKVMAGLRAETQDLQDQKEELETKLLVLQKNTTSTKDEFDMAQSTLDLCLSTEQKEKSKLEQLKTSLENGTTTLKQCEQEYKNLKAQIPDDEKSLKSARAELQKVQDEEATKSLELRRVRSSVEENRSAMQATRSQGRVLSFLMKEKQTGRIKGIMGRLGDLGAIDLKYDVAVSTACGSLDNIVVDTVETAQICIKALKDNDTGRATFIALDKQEHLRSLAESKINTPEGVPRLYDLIRVKDDEVKTAFYFALRDTLVAEDLTQASRIAYGKQRYRVVTLEGQVIETSGTMSGGGRKKLQGRMGNQIPTSVSPKEQQNLEKAQEKLEQEVTELRQRRTALENTVSQLDSTLPALRMKLNKDSIEIQSLQEQIPIIREQLKRQTQRVSEAKPNPAEVKRLTETRDKAQAAYDKAAEAANAIQKQVKQIHNKIMDMTKGRVNAAQKKLDDIVKRMTKIRQERTKLSVGIKTAIRNQKISKERITNMEADIVEVEGKIVKLQEEKTELEISGAKLLKEMNEYAAIVAQKEEDIVQLKGKKIAADDRTAIRSEMMELDQKIEDVQKKIQDCMSYVSQGKKKRAALKLRQIPGREVGELTDLTPEELEELDVKRLQWELSVAEKALSEKSPNLSVIKQYEEKSEQYILRTKELDEVTLQRNEAREALEKVRQRRLLEFLDGYSVITSKLKEMYQMLTLGGDAELELVDSLDPFSEGIVFSVRPPKKSWKNISNLSGGEKTLSSLALVFALHFYKPSPLFVMDEIDAALDFKNVSIVGNYIKERTKNAQFIIVSLRSNMFELADHLIGIYKIKDCTKVVAINPSLYVKANEDNQEAD